MNVDSFLEPPTPTPTRLEQHTFRMHRACFGAYFRLIELRPVGSTWGCELIRDMQRFAFQFVLFLWETCIKFFLKKN